MNEERVLELTDATVVKNGIRILDDLTLSIRSGQHTAIVGPNGSGKTTLMNVLTQQDHPLARENGVPPVLVFGESLMDLFDLRLRVGIVTADLHQRFVNGNSAGNFSGETAVLSGFFGTQGIVYPGSLTPAMRETARQALQDMEATHLAPKPLDEMSTGEARRVLIARALVTSPRALVLDEPTTGLDMVARERFLALVSKVARRGTTVVLVTHHVEEIIPEIDHVILLARGRVAVSGAKTETLTSENLTTVFGAPITLHTVDGAYYAHLGAVSPV
jgi:iron complex transport system ATP-binding protein